MLKNTSDVPVKYQNQTLYNVKSQKIPRFKQQLLWKPANLYVLSRLTFLWRALTCHCVSRLRILCFSFFLWLSHDWHFVKNSSYVVCMCAACVSLEPYLHALVKFRTEKMSVASRLLHFAPSLLFFFKKKVEEEEKLFGCSCKESPLFQLCALSGILLKMCDVCMFRTYAVLNVTIKIPWFMKNLS